jgi:1,4-dihydroxy-2-naphthoate octaprenyltransferase
MSKPHSKEEILSVMKEIDVATVATASGTEIRSRMMHYWNDESFNVYVATMKGDPKTLQITENPSVSLLILKRKDNINDSAEIEVTGKANHVKNETEKQQALQALAEKSPVVKYLKETNSLGVLDCVKVAPVYVKYRVFKDIVQGMPPTVLEFPENKLQISEVQQIKKKLGRWAIELRGSFFTATIVSVILGASIAWMRNQVFNPLFFLLTLVGGVLLHAGTNVLNDYFDYKSGNDQVNIEFVRPFSGGSRMIQLGLLTPFEVLSGALLFYILGSAIGLYLTWAVGPIVLLLGLIGLISGFFYTAPPVSWASKGLGEVLIGLNFGMLVTLGSYYVQTGTVAVEPLVASIPVSLLIAAVVYINEFPDYKADKAVGKDTLVVRLGRSKAAYGYLLMMLGTYTSIALGVLIGILPIYTLVGLVTIPLTVKAVKQALKYHSSPFDLIPANIATITCHLFTSLLLSLGYLIQGFGSQNILYTVLIGSAFTAFTVMSYRGMEKQKDIFLGLKKNLQT